jgi:hypothetical protein
MVRDQPEEWGERDGLAARAGLEKRKRHLRTVWT